MKRLDWMGVAALLISWLSLAIIHPDVVALGLLGTAILFSLMRGRLNISRTQWLLWSLLGLMISMVFCKPESKRALASGLVYANLYPVAVSLGFAILPALLRRHTRREYWTTMSLSGVFLLVCGMNLAPLTAEFTAMSALWMVFFCFSSRRLLMDSPPSLSAYATLVPTMIVLGLAAAAFQYSEAQFSFLMRFLSAGSDVTLSFPAQNHLNTLISTEANPAVVARCFSKRPNQYLPARVYTQYKDGAWSEFGPSSEISGRSAPTGYRYQICQPELAATVPIVQERFEVRASPIVLFAPRDTAWMELSQPQLAQLSGHLLEMRGGGSELQAYTVARVPEKDLAPPESAEYLESCLQLPAGIHPIVAASARKVLGDGPPWQRGLRCTTWFHENFKYGYGYDFASKADPISDFLLERPQAHCEIFAATMTLMLRTQGIPARYINGFVCVEPSFAGDYWIVRVRDAHAWVELWDGTAWRTLDPTPPSALQPHKSWGEWFDSMREAFNYYTGALGSLDWRAWIALLWEQRRYGGAFFVLLALWKMRRASWFPKATAKKVVDDQHSWIRRLSTTLGGQQLSREQWETVLQWSTRLRQSGLMEVASWLEEYSAFRYGAGTPEQELSLGARLQQLLKTLQNRPS